MTFYDQCKIKLESMGFRFGIGTVREPDAIEYEMTDFFFVIDYKGKNIEARCEKSETGDFGDIKFIYQVFEDETDLVSLRTFGLSPNSKNLESLYEKFLSNVDKLI